MQAKKKQRVSSLTQREFALQRPEVYYGSVLAAPCRVPVWDASAKALRSDVCHALSPAARRLVKEAFDNCLDNCARGGVTYIKAAWKDGVLVISNDGSTPPVEQNDFGDWIPTLAFSRFNSGANFDDSETGAKDVAATVGMNGLGAKGLNCFATDFTVHVNDSQKVFAQTWTKNMGETKKPRVRDANEKEKMTTEVKISWKPDLARLNSSAADVEKVSAWYAFAAAICAPSGVRVFWNGKLVGMRTPQDLCKALGGTTPIARAEGKGYSLCVCGRPPTADDAAADDDDVSNAGAGVGLDFGFVNGTPCSHGTHAKHVLGAVSQIVGAKMKSKNPDATFPLSFVAKHVIVVLVCEVPNPRFDSQAKEVLKTNLSEFGWRFEPQPDFVSAILRGPLVAAALEAAREREDREASKLTKKAARGPTVAKHERAHVLGKGTASLFVTEGDSAKNFAVAGISVVGRKNYGVYPIRGKFLNVRGMKPVDVAKNKEASELLGILGLQLNHEYTKAEALRLPYRHLVILADQDVDGSHIAGLLMNFVAVCAPSLLRVLPDFVCRFATALIRVRQPGGKQDLSFYTEEAYKAELDAGRAKGVASYYKGLGTSSNAQAKEYFRDLKKNTIVIRRDDEVCDDSLDLFFNSKRSDDRKASIAQCESVAPLDYSLEHTSFAEFVQRELLPSYAKASIERAIPRLEDGLKPSGRKALWAARKVLREPISVANAAGKFASLSHYHHRGTAMEGTIVHMAIDYVGAPNVNLFTPLGQFGSRHSHAPASAAYPKIALEAIADKLFPPADAPVLTYVEDEGVFVEPEVFVGVIPASLCFGGKGIATGWRTELPQFDPKDLVRACELAAGADRAACESFAAQMKPFFRGFSGTVVADDKGGWNVCGRYERRGDELHVLDVPPVKENDAFKEDWSKNFTLLEGDGHTDSAFHVILKDFEFEKWSSHDDIVSALQLSKRVSFDNAFLLYGSATLPKQYKSVYEVLVAHSDARLALYDRRLEHEREKALQASRIARDRARFIRECIDQSIAPLSSFEDDEALSVVLAERGYGKDADGTFKYLSSMPVRSFTVKKMKELNEAAADADRRYDELVKTTANELWTKELKELAAVL
jgi:DNA topoisomerase-2